MIPEAEYTAEELAALGPALAKHQARAAAIDQANANPLPGPLLDAFLPEPLVAAGLVLRECTATDLAILKRIDSPLLAEFENLRKPEAERTEVPWCEEAIWELLFLWTRPIAEARAALLPSVLCPPTSVLTPAENFREAALRATGDKLSPAVLLQADAIKTALAANFIRAFATALEYQDRPSGEGATVFTPPPDRATASAGGCTPSAASRAPSGNPPKSSPTNGHSARSSLTAPGPSKPIHGETWNAPATAM